jgi:hypothetical protein
MNHFFFILRTAYLVKIVFNLNLDNGHVNFFRFYQNVEVSMLLRPGP